MLVSVTLILTAQYSVVMLLTITGVHHDVVGYATRDCSLVVHKEEDLKLIVFYLRLLW